MGIYGAMAVIAVALFYFFQGDRNMKAHASEKRDIILSIGMIVKNEEKVLERCLKSMQPLMKAIPCELIIADTGSTDSTVEIAKKYTDNVFHFEWINDFAAARNSTLEKAKGQWYMFIDADEYFDEDIGEMIHFFNIPELCSKYKTLEIMVRSYTNPEKTDYRDGCLARFHRIDDPVDQVHFIGKIHEGIWIRQPLGYFSTIIHHTGYCFSSAQQNMDKKNRNLQLMREEYKNNPTDLRMLSHLIDGTSYEIEEKEKYICEAIEIAKKERNHLYANVVYMQVVSHFQNRRPEYALELCDEYCETMKDHEKYVATVAIMLFKAKILSALARYEQSYEAFCKYFDLYKLYKEDKLDITDAAAHPIDGVTEQEYIRYRCMAALDLKRIKKYEKAFELIDEFDVNELNGEDFKNVLGTVREICQDMKKYDMLAYYYDKIMKCEDDNKKSLALFMLESTYYSIVGTDKRKEYAKDIVDTGISGKYCELMNLVLTEEDTDFKEKLENFIVSVDNWKDGYCEAIYLAVKHGLDLSNTIDIMKSSEFRSKLEQIAVNHDDFAGFVLDYGIPESYTASIKRFFWITSLYEKASYRSFNLDDNRKYEIYTRFTNLLGEYVSNIYNPELLEDEADVEVLPQLHRFGYYMLKANSALKNENSIEYIRGLKKALVNCESMKEIIKFLMEQFKKTIKL